MNWCILKQVDVEKSEVNENCLSYITRRVQIVVCVNVDANADADGASDAPKHRLLPAGSHFQRPARVRYMKLSILTLIPLTNQCDMTEGVPYSVDVEQLAHRFCSPCQRLSEASLTLLTVRICSASFSRLSSRASFSMLSIPRDFRAFYSWVRVER